MPRLELISFDDGFCRSYLEQFKQYASVPDDSRDALLNSLLKAAVLNEEIRGSILVATDSDVIFASGSRSREVNGGTVTPATVYEIGSITKMHTAVCVFRLIDEGGLRPGDKVTQFFPEYVKAGDMTVCDLLHMRSGIMDFANDAETFFGSAELAEALDEGRITDEILLERLYQLDLAFTPGSKDGIQQHQLCAACHDPGEDHRKSL